MQSSESWGYELDAASHRRDRQAARECGVGKGLGWDGGHPHDDAAVCSIQ
jgi:hypothetical protein